MISELSRIQRSLTGSPFGELNHRLVGPKRVQRLRRSAASALGAAIFALGASACATVPPPPPPERSSTITVPQVTPLPETAELQRKGGISISVAPYPVSVEPDSICDFRPSDALVLFTPSGVSRETHKLLDVEMFPTQRVVGGDTLKFYVTIHNQLPRVFRGAGAVVNFAIDGQLHGTAQERYEELVTAMIAPRVERQLTISGPSLGGLPDNSVVAVSLYDIVTETDAAGNVTEKQNFEWFFEVKKERRVETVTGRRDRVWLENSQADRTMAIQARGIKRCDLPL